VNSGRRITIGLIGLLLLAVVGWLVTELTHDGRPGGAGFVEQYQSVTAN